jgi:hypothetical protein
MTELLQFLAADVGATWPIFPTATYVAGTTISLIVATHGLLDLNEHGTENASV